MIRFGSWSTILALAAGFGLLVCVLLLATRRNRVANRLLAALLFVAVLRLVPYAIGFAGFYDAYPWLSFAPFDLGLAIGPLLYFYLRRLATPMLPGRWGWHFVPAAIDLVYMLWAFSLPLPAKSLWNDTIHVRFIVPVEAGAGILSIAIYLIATIRFRRRYQSWLADHVSDREDHRQPWIGTILVASALWLLVTIGFDAYDWFAVPLSYQNRFPQYLVFAALILWLGLEGWRYAGHVFPQMVEPDAPPDADGRDWRATAQTWLERIDKEGWWREPGLTVGDVARRLATNETYVSRAFNEGLGQNFNAVINGLRVDEVKTGLADRDAEILTLALDAGFSSKASFNRAFRAHSGVSPSAWRAAHNLKIANDPPSGTTPDKAEA